MAVSLIHRAIGTQTVNVGNFAFNIPHVGAFSLGQNYRERMVVVCRILVFKVDAGLAGQQIADSLAMVITVGMLSSVFLRCVLLSLHGRNLRRLGETQRADRFGLLSQRQRRIGDLQMAKVTREQGEDAASKSRRTKRGRG